MENHKVEEEGKAFQWKQGKGGGENLRGVMGEKKTSSKVCETGKGFLTSVFLSENYPVISKGTECKIW